MMRSTELAHLILGRTLKHGDWAVDATVGNGHDTLFLAQRVGPPGRVFGFDVQEAALASASERVLGLEQVTLFHAGHEHLAQRLPDEAKGRLAAVMFNLGYLPGGSHAIATRTGTTLAGLDQALDRLQPGGLVTLVLYPGHPGGEEEAYAVRSHVERLPAAPYAATRHAQINVAHPAPELLIIERRR